MGLRRLLPAEDQQYAPFVGGAIVFGLVGFPLGATLAHAAAQGSTLGGRWAPLAQVHGHLQLVGWVGLFVMGMGYRLVPRFTGVKVRPGIVVPLTLAMVLSGLVLRAAAQPFADEAVPGGLFVAAAALEALGVVLFAASLWRCLILGRRREFLHAPFFAAGALWLAVAAGLGLVFAADAAVDSRFTISPQRSAALTFILLYGFATMFIFAVSLRTFPIFFERPPAQRGLTLIAWALANGGVAIYAAALLWQSYDRSADVRVTLTVALLVVGVALAAMLAVLRIFEGTPHRLRASARRSMRFVRSAYAWLLVAAALQVFVAGRALSEGRPVEQFEMDAVRHFVAVGFVTVMIFGMALLVLPPLAMRRAQAQAGRLAVPALLALVHAAAASRGAGSLLASEMEIESGYWTMTAAGVGAVLALGVFAAYLLWPSQGPEIAVAARPSPASRQR